MKGQPTLLFCVGATKAGTTWLYRHLAGHPDCHLRGIKELHYFDTLEHGRLRRRRDLLEGKSARSRARGAVAKRDFSDWIAVLAKGREDVPAYLGYLVDGIGAKRLVADITPAYALLPEARLRMMAGILPDVRFVYMLRDPVSRLWSQIRMLASRASTGAAEIPVLAERMLRELLSGVSPQEPFRLDYAGAIRRLTAAVDPRRLMIGFSDEIISAEGIARLWAFLGIRPAAADVDRRIFAGPNQPLGEPHARAMREFLAPQYAFVEAHFGRLPESWRRSPAEMAA